MSKFGVRVFPGHEPNVLNGQASPEDPSGFRAAGVGRNQVEGYCGQMAAVYEEILAGAPPGMAEAAAKEIELYCDTSIPQQGGKVVGEPPGVVPGRAWHTRWLGGVLPLPGRITVPLGASLPARPSKVCINPRHKLGISMHKIMGHEGHHLVTGAILPVGLKGPEEALTHRQDRLFSGEENGFHARMNVDAYRSSFNFCHPALVPVHLDTSANASITYLIEQVLDDVSYEQLWQIWELLFERAQETQMQVAIADVQSAVRCVLEADAEPVLQSPLFKGFDYDRGFGTNYCVFPTARGNQAMLYNYNIHTANSLIALTPDVAVEPVHIDEGSSVIQCTAFNAKKERMGTYRRESAGGEKLDFTAETKAMALKTGRGEIATRAERIEYELDNVFLEPVSLFRDRNGGTRTGGGGKRKKDRRR